MAQTVAGLVHGLAADSICYSRVHHDFSKTGCGLVERGGCSTDCFKIIAAHNVSEMLLGCVDGGLLGGVELHPCGVVVSLGDRVQNGVGFIFRFDQLPLCEVLLGIVERLEDHGFNLLIGQPIGRLDFNLGSLPRALLSG